MNYINIFILQYRVLTLFLILSLTPIMLFSQNSELYNTRINIYLDVGKVDSSFSSFMDEHSLLSNKRLTLSMINPLNDGCAQLDVVTKYINQMFPNKFAEGVCIVDWEGQAIRNLKEFAKGDSKWAYQIQEYIKVVDTIKALRPNLKVGIYNIPFRNYSKYKVASNPYDYTILYPLLKKADLICPSPYKPYANSEVGEELSKNFFENYLEQAIRIKNHINKPVFPYLAMRYYNETSEFHNKLIPIHEFTSDLEHVLKSNVEGSFVDGIILWNGDRWKFEQDLRKMRQKKANDLKGDFLSKHYSMLKRYILVVDSLGRN